MNGLNPLFAVETPDSAKLAKVPAFARRLEWFIDQPPRHPQPRDASGRRPVFGGHARLNGDPNFRELIPFHEYFHGDDSSGVGASHQTGWTGLVAKLLQQSQELPAEQAPAAPNCPAREVAGRSLPTPRTAS